MSHYLRFKKKKVFDQEVNRMATAVLKHNIKLLASIARGNFPPFP